MHASQLRGAAPRAPALRRPAPRAHRARCVTYAAAAGRLGDTAVVVGASLGGVLSAAALSPFFGRVVVLDRDGALPGVGDAPRFAPRRGVPQSSQPHVLFARGLEELEKALPGVTADVLAAGALRVDWAAEFRVWAGGAWAAQSERSAGGEVASLTCSRYLLESAARRRLAETARNVEFRPNARVAGLLRAGEAVGGVLLDTGETVPAALTVDAAGRGSCCAAWLAQAGFPADVAAPAAATVDGGLRYATRVFSLPPDVAADEDALGFKVLLLSHEAPSARRLGYAARLEGGRLVATLGGYERDAPPLDDAGWRAFAASLPGDGAFLRALRGAQPEAGFEVAQAHAATANVRRAFRAVPGLAHVGDAALALCPAYGQGMTMAALAAAALRDAAAKAADDVAAGRADAPAALAALAAATAAPMPEASAAWALAAGQDAAFPAAVVSSSDEQNSAAKPKKAAMPPPLAWYVAALRRRAATDPAVWRAMLRVAHLLAPPQSLFAPQLAASVIAAEARDAWQRRQGTPKDAAA